MTFYGAMRRSILVAFVLVSACNPTYATLLEREAPFFADFRARMARIDADVTSHDTSKADVPCAGASLTLETTDFISSAVLHRMGLEQEKKASQPDYVADALPLPHKQDRTMNFLSWTQPELPYSFEKKKDMRATDLVIRDLKALKAVRHLVVVRPRTATLYPQGQARFITTLRPGEPMSADVLVAVRVYDVAAATLACSFEVRYPLTPPPGAKTLDYGMIDLHEKGKIIDAPASPLGRGLEDKLREAFARELHLDVR